jgi:hypothetical protein
MGGGSLYKDYSQLWFFLFLGAGGSFLVCALFFPTVLSPLNKAWFRLGLLLGKIASPIVLGAIFFLMITPVALLMRLGGRDVLGLRRKKSVSSYWIDRTASEPNSSSFKNQF